MLKEILKPEQEPQFIDLFSVELEDQLRMGQKYKRKIEPIKGAEQVAKDCSVQTILPDGTIESEQDARLGDWIITGSKDERFVFTDKKFHSLYETDGEKNWIPRERKIVAIHNPLGRSIRISAPWGTPEKPAYQDGSNQAMLVAELSADGNMTMDRYIIGDEEMLLNNYVPVENFEKK